MLNPTAWIHKTSFYFIGLASNIRWLKKVDRMQSWNSIPQQMAAAKMKAPGDQNTCCMFQVWVFRCCFSSINNLRRYPRPGLYIISVFNWIMVKSLIWFTSLLFAFLGCQFQACSWWMFCWWDLCHPHLEHLHAVQSCILVNGLQSILASRDCCLAFGEQLWKHWTMVQWFLFYRRNMGYHGLLRKLLTYYWIYSTGLSDRLSSNMLTVVHTQTRTNASICLDR